VLQVKEHAPILHFSVVFSWDSHLSPSRSWERITLKDSIMNLKVKIMEGEGIGVHSLTCNISEVEGVLEFRDGV
jgi:hypothetical protein